MAQHNRNNWHHIPGIGGIMATGLSMNSKNLKIMTAKKYEVWLANLDPRIGTETGKTRPVLIV
ncbi:MAG: type II toxin-antitoxin system PemK/MazF family toxin, partial [Bacteroidota bacterium]